MCQESDSVLCVCVCVCVCVWGWVLCVWGGGCEREREREREREGRKMVKILSGNVIFLAMCVAFIAGGWLYAGW